MVQNKNEYKPQEIERKWQKIWEENKTYSPDLKNSKNPYYTLMMFPYPSAEGLHIGNMYAFTGADIHGRYMRMKGKDVFEPIGLDGFGIHSENYALKVGRHPKDQAKISQKNFYRQLRATGNAYDWTRTVETYDPDYYRWTQWMFVQMFKKGLAYRKKAQVNWCPSCKTVIADEQVLQKIKNQKSKIKNTSEKLKVNGVSVGVCERCETEVEKRDLEQWFFKITDYADRLLAGLDQIDWPEKIKIAQRQWIGKSEGTRIRFPIQTDRKYIILHGHKGSPDTDFHPWLKQELEKLGAKVEVPHLPGGLNPNIEDQVDLLLNNFDFDENTVLVTHSLGGVAAMKLLPRLKKKIAKLVMISPPLRTEFIDKPRPELEKATDWKFDFEEVKSKADEIVVLSDIKDDVVPASQPREIAKRLEAKLLEVEAPSSHFNCEQAPQVLAEVADSVEVFTTRPDTLFGATFLVLAPEHPIVHSIKDKKVQDYVERAKKKTDKERMENKDKTGVFSGLYAINPVNNEKIPVWVADYAVMGYGTGALFGDAHDERDVEFARKYNIPLKPTLLTGDKKRDERIKNLEECFTGYGTLFDSGEFSGLSSEDAKKKITAWLKEHNAGGPEITYHLRDWLISRQRYWGPPIPMVFCSTCEKNGRGEREDMLGWWTVPENQLPILLPDVEDWRPAGTGTSPLANHPEFYNAACPECNGPARRETDVSDTFLDSAWYYLRYLSIGLVSANKMLYDIEIIKKWCPVAIYIGGAEHSVLHLLYVRFIAMVLHDLNDPKLKNLALPFEEPFPRFFAHGLIIKERAKMSKSRGNIVIPDEYIEKYGADALRMYLMFLGPFSQGGDFRDSGIEGMHRFVRRVWTLLTRQLTTDNSQLTTDRLRFMNKTIKAVTQDIESFSYNTAIARMMEWYNFLSEELKTQNSKLKTEEAEVFLKLLAPFAPHFTEELWHQLEFGQETIHAAGWPVYQEKYLVQDQVTIVVQINGKRRGEIRIMNNELGIREKVEEQAREAVRPHLEGKEIRKVIYVPAKIINFVV